MTGYSSKLLKRSDQCRAICACSYLSWQQRPEPSSSGGDGDGGGGSQPPVQDMQKVMACLRRAIKVANAAKQQLSAAARTKDSSYLGLYVEVLNHYLHFMEAGSDIMTPAVVQQLLELVQNEIKHCDVPLDHDTQVYWHNTCKHIEARKAAQGEQQQRYAALALNNSS